MKFQTNSKREIHVWGNGFVASYSSLCMTKCDSSHQEGAREAKQVLLEGLSRSVLAQRQDSERHRSPVLQKFFELKAVDHCETCRSRCSRDARDFP